MGTRKLAILIGFVLLSAVMWSAAMAQTETAKPADNPTGEQVIARFVNACGGMDAYAKLNTRYQHASVEMMAGLKLPITIYQSRPNKMKTIMSNDQIGNIERCYDGTLFWEKMTMTGTRLLEGQELADGIREEATFDKISAWKELYDSSAYIGTDSAAGSLCQKIRVYPKNSPDQIWFFDKANGMLLKISMTMVTQMGPVPADVVISDYRKVDGIMIPFKMTTSAAGMDMAMVLDSVAHNIVIPDSIFAAPADVLELVKQKKQ